MSRVDVVVPCYNYARYLTQCVDSILAHNNIDVRVLIIDDASSDDTAIVARTAALRDARISIRRHEVNRGNIATYNEGIDWATSEYFLLLSADDWLVPGALERAAKVFTEHPEVVLTCGRAAVAERGQAPPNIGHQNDRPGYYVLAGQTFIETACSKAAAPPICTATAVVRTSIQKAIGGYSNELPHAGDLEMWLRLACRGEIAFLDAYQAVYRKHEANMHYSFGGLANLRQHVLAFESAFEKDVNNILNPKGLRRRYRRVLAAEAVKLATVALRDGDARLFRECAAFALNVYTRHNARVVKDVRRACADSRSCSPSKELTAPPSGWKGCR
jgi:glycosyltransferase involved in cell wall biosynthesis